MRLIDADALREEHCKDCAADIQQDCKSDPVCASLMWVDEAPTIDAVPVVRCKECKHWEKGDFQSGHSIDHMEWGGGCPYAQFARYESDFCSRGERKGEDDV